MNVDLPDHSGLSAHLYFFLGGRADVLECLRVAELRYEVRDINGSRSHESLEEIYGVNLKPAFLCMWESYGADHRVQRSYVWLEMIVGKYAAENSKNMYVTIRNAGALILWDRVSSRTPLRDDDAELIAGAGQGKGANAAGAPRTSPHAAPARRLVTTPPQTTP